jgi:hypothetical protein
VSSRCRIGSRRAKPVSSRWLLPAVRTLACPHTGAQGASGALWWLLLGEERCGPSQRNRSLSWGLLLRLASRG